MKKINIYTDLALEERERFKRNIEISGVKIDKNYNKELFMTTTDVEIFNENGAKSMGKPIRLIHWDQKLPSRLKFCLMCTVWLRGCWLRPVWKLFQ